MLSLPVAAFSPKPNLRLHHCLRNALLSYSAELLAIDFPT
jgi:hypothetical protein